MVFLEPSRAGTVLARARTFFGEPTRTPLSERTIAAARQVLEGRRRGRYCYLAFVGPAIVASIAYMDPGNFATNIQAGSKYG